MRIKVHLNFVWSFLLVCVCLWDEIEMRERGEKVCKKREKDEK